MNWYKVITCNYDGWEGEVPVHLGNYVARNKGEAKAKCKEKFKGYCHPINQLDFSDMIAIKLPTGAEVK